MAHIVECDDCGAEFDISTEGGEIETAHGAINLCPTCYEEHLDALDAEEQEEDDED